MSSMNDDKLIDQVRLALDASIADLDPDITARLDQLRHQAVAAAEEVQLDAQQVTRMRQALDDSLQLDAATTARLNQIRQQALEHADSRKFSLDWATSGISRLATWLESYRLAVPASVFASACLIVTVVALTYNSSTQPGTAPIDEELLLVASADDIELYENLDFYLWLAENGLPN